MDSHWEDDPFKCLELRFDQILAEILERFAVSNHLFPSIAAYNCFGFLCCKLCAVLKIVLT